MHLRNIYTGFFSSSISFRFNKKYTQQQEENICTILWISIKYCVYARKKFFLSVLRFVLSTNISNDDDNSFLGGNKFPRRAVEPGFIGAKIPHSLRPGTFSVN